MVNFEIQQYTDWKVKSVMRIKEGFGFRIVLKYMDGTQKVQQKSGFSTKREAEKAREKIIAELYNGSYIAANNVTVQEFLELWLEEDIKKRTENYNTYMTFSYCIKNHILPILGQGKKMMDVTKPNIVQLYKINEEQSQSVAKMVRTIINLSFAYAEDRKLIKVNPAKGLRLPKSRKQTAYHTRNIDTKKTLNLEQIETLIEASKDTPIYMMVLFNVLMGLRRSEIIAVKYSDVDYINRTLKIERQLGVSMVSDKKEIAPKMYTKQEIGTKTRSSVRSLPIPDYVFEAILQERKKYEANRNRRKKQFQDLDYICCSSYGRPRSKDYHWKYYKQILAENGLPDIRWHDLRSTYCTMLLKQDFNMKAVSKLMGHAKEIITVDVYGDNSNIIVDAVPELDHYIKEVIPDNDPKQEENLLDVVIDTKKYKN